MFVEILTPDKKLYSGEAEYVDVPGSAGRTGVLNHHAPIISSLISGHIMVKESTGKESLFEIRSGIMEVSNNHVIVLAE